MTTLELQQALIALGTPAHAYSLTGGFPNEAYCLDGSGGGWRVYYSERGNKNSLASFANESEACQFFLNVIITDVMPHHPG